MKIDYELVERIGAEYISESGTLYKLNDSFLDEWSDHLEAWVGSGLTLFGVLCYKLKPIPPKTQPEFEYVRLDFDSLFDYQNLFEDREIYVYSCDTGNYSQVEGECHLAKAWVDDYLYKRIEKPHKTTQDIINEWSDNLKDGDLVFNCVSYDEKEFINLCKQVIENEKLNKE